MANSEVNENKGQEGTVSDKAHYDNQTLLSKPDGSKLYRIRSVALRVLGRAEQPDPSHLSTAPELCPDCGRDLAALGEYRDYVHYQPNTLTPCLPPIDAPQANLTPLAGIQDDDC